MTKKEARKLLDKARHDHLVPIRLINQALILTGDIDVQKLDFESYQSLRHDGNESIYRRSRSLHGQTTT